MRVYVECEVCKRIAYGEWTPYSLTLESGFKMMRLRGAPTSFRPRCPEHQPAGVEIETAST